MLDIFTKKIWQVLFLISIVVFLFWPAYQFDFLYGWDDQWFVTNNYTEGGLGWKNFYNILTDFYYGQYAPLNQLYYTTIFTFFGYNTAVYHIAGICIHSINVLLVYFLMELTIPNVQNETFTPHNVISFMTALLFAIMPINVEPIVWVSASKVLLYAMFYLLSLICYSHFLKSDKAIYYYLTILCFILSFGAKEQAVTIPVCLLLFDLLYSRRFTDIMVWYEKVPFFIISLIFGLITLQSQGLEEERHFYPIYQRLPLAFYTLSEYFTKILFPVNLSYLYPFPFAQGENVPWWLWTYVISLPTTVFCFIKKLRMKWVYFGLLFFLINILMVINMFSLARHSVVADRYAYLSSVGLSFFLVNLFFFNYKNKTKKYFSLIAFLLYVVALFTYSSSYMGVWKNVDSVKQKLRTAIECQNQFENRKNRE